MKQSSESVPNEQQEEVAEPVPVIQNDQNADDEDLNFGGALPEKPTEQDPVRQSSNLINNGDEINPHKDPDVEKGKFLNGSRASLMNSKLVVN